MVNKKGIVWNYFTKKIYGAQITAYCKFCDQSYVQNATRMEKHIVRCEKCPEIVKREFLSALRNKKAKSVMALRLAGNWSESGAQRQQISEECSEAILENLPDWQFNSEIDEVEDSTTSNNGNENNDHDVDSKDWNKDLSMQHEQPQEILNWVSVEEQGNNDRLETAAAQTEEEPEVTYTRRPRNKRFSQLPILSKRISVNSIIQNKIQQEELLEKRALRRIAELELQMKNLEYEKCKWRFQKEKTQNEVRWTHECRMMQLKEEHQQQMTKLIPNNSVVSQHVDEM